LTGSGRGVAGPTASDISTQRSVEEANRAENQAQNAIDAALMRSGAITAGTSPFEAYNQVKTVPTEPAVSPYSAYDQVRTVPTAPLGSPLDAYSQVKTVPTSPLTSPFDAYSQVKTVPTSQYPSGFDAASAAAQLAKTIVTPSAGGEAKTTPAGAGRSTVPSPTDKVPMPPIPYRDLGQGNILDNILKVFGMDTESWINNKAKEYEKQGMSPSDAAIQASYDLRDLQMSQRNREGGGGGRDNVQAAAPVLPPSTTTAATTPAAPIAKLPGVAAPYIPPGYTPSGAVPASTYADLGAAASVQRQAAYNQAIENAMRLLGLA